MFSIDITPFVGFNFWAISFGFICIYILFFARINRSLFRNFFMILVSSIIVTSVVGIQLFCLLLLLILIVYISGYILTFYGSEKSYKLIFFGVISIVIFNLCYFKYSCFQLTINSFWDMLHTNISQINKIEKHIFFIGVSYFCFKFIHFLIDCHNQKLKELSIFTFLNYTLFYPSFFSGPINRYGHFARSIQEGGKNISFHDGLIGIKRIINGLFKKVVLAASLFPYSIAAMDFNDPSFTPVQAIIGIYAYMFYIYFDFSGYTDMAIGCSKLVGVELPENFNYPFFKRNLQQFWANWHMSLTTWLTDYIYWPLARKMRHLNKLRRKPVTVSNICIVSTFIICGVWHGDGIQFFLWGLYHGIGLAILNVYTFIERKYFSLKWKKFINQSSSGYLLSNFITFQYVAFGFLLFACSLEKQKIFFQLFV